MTAVNDIQIEDVIEADPLEQVWAAFDRLIEAQEQWDREHGPELTPIA